MRIKWNKRNIYFRDQSIVDSFLYMTLLQKYGQELADKKFDQCANNFFLFKSPKSLRNIHIMLNAFGLTTKINSKKVLTKLGESSLEKGIMSYMINIANEMKPLKDMLTIVEQKLGDKSTHKLRLSIIESYPDLKSAFLDFCPKKGYENSGDKYLSSFIGNFKNDFQISIDQEWPSTPTLKNQIYFNKYKVKKSDNNWIYISLENLLTAFVNITDTEIKCEEKTFVKSRIFSECINNVLNTNETYHSRTMIDSENFIDAYYNLFSIDSVKTTKDLEVEYVGKNNNTAYINSFINNFNLNRDNFHSMELRDLKDFEYVFYTLIQVYGFGNNETEKIKTTKYNDLDLSLNPEKKQSKRSTLNKKIHVEVDSNKSVTHSMMLDTIKEYAKEANILEFELEYKNMDFVFKNNNRFNIVEVKSSPSGFYKAIGQLIYYKTKIGIASKDTSIRLFFVGNFELRDTQLQTLNNLNIEYLNIWDKKTTIEKMFGH